MSRVGRVREIIAALALVPAVLGAALLGLRVPSVAELPRLPPPEAFGLLRVPGGGFPPLRDGFVAEALGLPVERTRAEAPEAAGVRSPETSEPPVRIHPLTNDDLVNAFVIDRLPFRARTETTQATREPGEPDRCAVVGNTVWYRFRAPRSMGLIANTFGTDRATAIGVFTGSPRRLRPGPCDTDARGNAQVAFAAVAGTTYFVQVVEPLGGGTLFFSLFEKGETVRVPLPSAQRDTIAIFGTTSRRGARIAVAAQPNAGRPQGDRDEVCADPVAITTAPLCLDVYVWDRVRGSASLASLSSDERRGDSHSGFPFITADGRMVAFASFASNLVEGDTNDIADIFVRDLERGTTERVSVGSQGHEATETLRSDTMASWEGSLWPTTSADGRFVAFTSGADNLVPNDRNGEPGDGEGFDVFVRDRRRGVTERVSISSSGEESEARPDDTTVRAPIASISPEGRFVAFESWASNLVRGDRNGTSDVFLHDRASRETVLVSVGLDGAPADGESELLWPGPYVSSGGRYVAFMSEASNLVPGDANNAVDVFVRDMVTERTERISLSSSGREGTGPSETATEGFQGLSPTTAISADGRFVVFNVTLNGLVPEDTDGLMDVYVRDRLTDTTTRISVSVTGQPADGNSRNPTISLDGSAIVFGSRATNLVDGTDANGAEWDAYLHRMPTP